MSISPNIVISWGGTLYVREGSWYRVRKGLVLGREGVVISE